MKLLGIGVIIGAAGIIWILIISLSTENSIIAIVAASNKILLASITKVILIVVSVL